MAPAPKPRLPRRELAEIVIKSSRKGGKNKKSFHVNYRGNNSEILSNSESLKSLNSAQKNIAAHIKLAHGNYMYVVHTGESDQSVYLLDEFCKVHIVEKESDFTKPTTTDTEEDHYNDREDDDFDDEEK